MAIISFILLILEIGTLITLCGAGPLVLLGKGVKKTGIAPLAISCALGIGVLGVISTFAFYLEWRPVLILRLALLISFASAILAVRLSGRSLKDEFLDLAAALRPPNLVLIAISTIFALVVFNSGYSHFFGQPLQLGIDEVGYSTTADYFAKGGTKTQAAASILTTTGQANLEYALNAHITSLSFNTNIVSEFLLKAHRFAYPLLLASLAQNLGLDPLADYQFCMLAVPLICATLLIAWLLIDIFALPKWPSYCASIAFLLNCNELAVLYEGQHAQIVVLPLFVLFFGLIFARRSVWNRRSTTAVTASLFLLSALVAASIFALYSDSLIALGAFGGVLLLADLLFMDWQAVRDSCFAGCAALCGMMCLGKYFTDWFGFIGRHLNNVGTGNGGFSQPHWAFLSEILGYSSMYAAVVPKLVPRSPMNLAVNAVWSVAIIAILIVACLLRDRRERRFWVAPFVVCLAVLVHLQYFHDYINYQYFKVYSMLLVPMFAVHFAALNLVARECFSASRQTERMASLAVAAIMCIPIVVGVRDCLAFDRASRRLTPEALQLRERFKTGALRKYAILTYPGGGLESAMLAAYIDFNWLNLGWADIKLSSHPKSEIAVLLFDPKGIDFNRLNRTGTVIFKGDDIALLRTGRKLYEFASYDTTVVANKPTNQISWPHKQNPAFERLLAEFISGLPRTAHTNDTETAFDRTPSPIPVPKPVFRLHLVESKEHTVKLYDSRSADSSISCIKEFVNPERHQFNQLVIHCSIECYNITGWADIFQTAMSNFGIRLEVNSIGTLAIVAGETGYILLDNFSRNRLYTLDLRIDPDGRTRAWIDGVSKLDVHYPGSFMVTDITVGTGYNKSRHFDGKIFDFRIGCQRFSKIFIDQASTD